MSTRKLHCILPLNQRGLQQRAKLLQHFSPGIPEEVFSFFLFLTLVGRRGVGFGTSQPFRKLVWGNERSR